MQTIRQLVAGAFFACLALPVFTQLKPAQMLQFGTADIAGQPKEIFVTADGGSVVVGNRKVKPPGSDIAWFKGHIVWLTPQGTIKKEVVLGGNEEGAIEIHGACLDPQTGDLYVTGETLMREGRLYTTIMEPGDHGSGDGFVVKYDKNGNELWAQVMLNDYTGFFRDVMLTADGRVLAVGTDYANNLTLNDLMTGNYKKVFIPTWLTFNYLTADGEYLGTVLPDVSYDDVTPWFKMTEAPDGTLWMVTLAAQAPGSGQTNEDVRRDCVIFHLTADGEVITQKVIEGANWVMIDDVVVHSNGNLLVSIRTANLKDIPDKVGAHILCYDENLNFLWGRAYGKKGGIENPHAVLAEAENGDIIGAMYTPDVVDDFAACPKLRCNVYLVRLSADGQELNKKSLLALDWYQSTECAVFHNGELRLMLEGCSKVNYMKEHCAWYVTVKGI